MSEERDVKPDVEAEDASTSQIDPVTPVKPKGAKINLKVAAPDGQRT
jgi:hypothetical protein